ncbi:unnamed protein product [Sympodiomycopsis kandeliae]
MKTEKPSLKRKAKVEDNGDQPVRTELGAEIPASPKNDKEGKKSPKSSDKKGGAWTPEKRLALLNGVIKQAQLTGSDWEAIGKQVEKTPTQAVEKGQI